MSDKKIGGHILPERMDRFTWHEGEIKILGTREEIEEQAKKEGRKVTWYDSEPKKISNKKTALYGAIIGDIVGSRFEGRGKKIKTKDFDFFAPACRFTDDTVMTVAVAEEFLHWDGNAVGMDILNFETKTLVEKMQRWGRKYPHGYGRRFKEWLFSDNPRPYGSFGNGSAMRVSAVGWYADKTDWVKGAAYWTAQVTHDHPEGIKGAESVAVAIFLARTGYSKEEIKNYIEKNFGYNLSRKIDDIRPTYHFDVTCQGSVPEAIIAFLDSTDFEDAVRNAVSLGGDSDTLAAITGSIAEAFYRIPDHLIKKCREFLPSDILAVVDKFNSQVVDELLIQAEIEADAEAGYFDDANDLDDEEPEEVEHRKRTALYGAILGDIIGVPFEFSEIRQKSKDFKLFSDKSKFSDDTVMTVAIADAILKTGHKVNVIDKETVYRNFVEDKATYKELYATFNGEMDYYNHLYKNVKHEMQCWGKKYPHAGYGGSFRSWLKEDNPKPYDSLGNGSAMRVAAAGWLFDSMFDTREVARYTSLPTHNHPDGIRGAEAVASAIFLARQNKSKEEIKSYLETEFDYDLSRSLDDVRKTCIFNETCPISVPEAIIAFLESTDFEDAIRNAVSLGGDSDTQAAIAGSIAEAFYRIPNHLITKCREYLSSDILEVVDKFNLTVGY